MQATDVVIGVATFALVAGYAALSWLRRGRDPRYLDDASILLPAPPPGMTAATATIVLGEDSRAAFMAALLDLASRDEIAFVAEGRQNGVDQVGIAIHGGDSTDPRVRLNRRNPIGEGESWLLGELKAWNAAEQTGPPEHGQPPSPEMMQAGIEMMAAMMRSGVASAEDDDSFAARAARERGLMNQALPDPSQFAAAYPARTGRAMKPEAIARLQQMSTMMSALKDPQSVADDPDRFLDTLSAERGNPLSDDDRAKAKEWIAKFTAAPAPTGADGSTPTADYIPAARARSLPAAFLLGPLLQKYALRHGWLVGMPFFARLKWRVLGVVEVLLGLFAAGIASTVPLGSVVALGIGLAAGGLATYLIAPAMASISVEGSVMKAQLAAYRRTLQASFAQATSIKDVASASRLSWLETPDQTVVWAVALDLQEELQALFRRVPQGLSETFALSSPIGAGGSTLAAASRPASDDDAAAMFAGIQAIGMARESSSRV
jgi:hypothetical protein